MITDHEFEAVIPGDRRCARCRALEEEHADPESLDAGATAQRKVILDALRGMSANEPASSLARYAYDRAVRMIEALPLR